MALTAGTILGQYEIRSPLGAGGMGEVYRARDTRLDRDVAIKVLPESLTSDPDRLRRFEQEARAAAALNHPNILAVYQMATHEGVSCMVTELLEGETLRERLRRGAIPLRKAIDYGVQIAHGLAAAHEKGIVHRDLKPENLFVTKDGRVKILDFGLAKLMPTASSADGRTATLEGQTEPGAVLGTVGYMSPEQVRGKSADHRSDIFAFGTVLYEMVTGRQTFRKPTKADTISAILNEEPPPISQVVPSVPPGLQRVAHRCLEKSPEQRFQSASDLAFALGALTDAPEERLQGLADVKALPHESNKESESGPIAAAARTRTLLPQTRWMLWLATVVICSLVAALLWFIFPRPKTPPRVLKAVPLTSSVGDEGSPTFSPDGNQIAFSWNGEKQDNTDIYVKLIGPGSPLRLTTDPAADIVPAWSPDGRTIAFLRDLGGGKYRILVIPALGGPQQKLLDVFIPEAVWLTPPYLAWLPDSKGIIYTNKDSPDHPSSLFLLLTESRETRRVTIAPDGSIGDSAPALSPDGSTLIFSRMTGVGPADLYLLRLKADFSPAGESKRVTFFNSNGNWASWTPDGRNIIFSHDSWLWKLAISRSGRAQGEPRRLELIGNGGDSPAVSNQGRRLAYVSGQWGPLNIWRMGLPGRSTSGQRNQASNGPAKLVASANGEFAPQYSPDGNKIAFESGRSGNLEIWTCQSDGSNCTRLTFLGAKFTGVPHWSPNGQQIAFYSRPEGKAQIYVINAEGGAARRLTNDSWENFFPVWSRDGRWIYFASNRSGTNQIWKIPSGGGLPVQVTQNGGFACTESADGKYLYYTRANESSSSLFRMPTEGGPETKVVDAVLLHNFAVTARGVYYMSQPDPRSNTKLIQLLSFADGKTTLIDSVKQNLYVGFSVSPDERWLLYAPSESSGSNVMLVEDFDVDAS